MEACATIADAIAVATTQGLEFSKFLLFRPSSILAISTAGMLPVDSIAPPRKAVRSDPYRTAPRAFVRRTRRTRRRSLTDDAGEDGFSGDGDGDYGAFGGGGGGGGGRWWNFDGYGGPDWEDSGYSQSSSSDPAFDFVYEVICWIVLSNCTHFAFKKVSSFLTDREKVVPMPSFC